MTATDPITQRLDQERVRKAAALWLSQLQLGSANEADFVRWRDQHPAHALEFARAFANWEALRNAVSEEDLHKPAETFTRRHLLRIAGGAAAAAAVGGAFWVSRYDAWIRIKTAVGEFRKISLPDTSVVELNTDTEMSWRLEGSRTVIALARGEIAVTLQLGVSTRLLSKVLAATLLAGAYNARYLSDRLRLSVVQGTALIDSGGKSSNPPVIASTGQTVTAAADRSCKIEPEDNMDAATAWRNGEIVFHDEPLIAAVAEYNRYLTRKITLAAPKAELQRVGGRFTTTNPQAFLRAVSIALDLQVSAIDGNYLLSPKI